MNKQIIQAIIKYAKENETDYAILLNGEWGSGKTFLWKNEIKPQIEKIDFKPIYVSLYGVTEIQEIGKMILLSSLNISEKYTKGKIPELLKSAINLINSVGSVLSKSISKDKLFQVKLEDLVNLDNKIICFDDLERVNLDITDVFGLINGLVEHDKAKVVILADEKKVSEKFQYSRIEEKTISALHYMVYQKTQNKKNGSKEKVDADDCITASISNIIRELYDKTDEYKNIKEKLIGKTIKLETDHALIIPGMVDGIAKNCIAGSFLNSYEQLIISVFNSSPKKNLRILKQAINDFCHLYVLLSEKEVELDNNILEPLLIFIIAFSLEVKSNHIREELFINIRTLNDLKSTNMSYKFFQSQEAKDIALFFDRYFEKGKYYDCSFEVAKSFILTSLIDEEKFVVDYTDIMQSASLTIEEIFLSADFWTLTDDEFHKAHLSTYKMLELGNYDASNYLNALNYYSYYISIGAVDLTIEKLEADLICGLEKAVTKTTEKVNIGKLTEGYSELLKTEHGKKMILTYENINTRLTESRLANVETELIEAITMSDDFHLKALFEYNATVPIFKYTDIDKLSNTLLTTSNEKIVNFARLIRKRYNNKYPYLAEEVPNIEKLKVQLQVYIEANEKSLKVGLLKRLVDELTSCIVKFK